MKSDGRDATELSIVRALDVKPEVSVPDGFAARVARQLPARSRVAVTPAHYGWIAMRIGIALLLVALVAVAMRFASHSAVGIALEWILCGEVVGLSLWLGGWKGVGAPEA
jgi:hypothetical protein